MSSAASGKRSVTSAASLVQLSAGASSSVMPGPRERSPGTASSSASGRTTLRVLRSSARRPRRPLGAPRSPGSSPRRSERRRKIRGDRRRGQAGAEQACRRRLDRLTALAIPVREHRCRPSNAVVDALRPGAVRTSTCRSPQRRSGGFSTQQNREPARASDRRPRLIERRHRDMNELPKRQLGRTGLQVTMLGYGAMEIRGAPRGRDVTDQQAETILHAVARRRHQLHRHLDRLRRERGAHRPLHRRPARRVLPGEQVRLPGRRAAGPARPDQPARLHPRQHPAGRGAEPRPHADRPSRRAPVPHLAVPADPGEGRRPRDGARAASGRARRGSSACPARCPTSSTTSPWACSTSSRSPTRRWSASTRRSSPRPPAPAPGSSSAAAPPRARPPRASTRACNGIDGRRCGWTTCSTA